MEVPERELLGSYRLWRQDVPHTVADAQIKAQRELLFHWTTLQHMLIILLLQVGCPLLHRLQELELLESWATDFLKLLGKFGRNLTAAPSSIYQQIPPFCPEKSTIYRQFEQNTVYSHSLSVKGITRTGWDDSLAKISLGSGCQTLAILCSGDHFAVLTTMGLINLYSSTTFELKQSLQHGERVCAMAFSSCSNLLATYGFRTTRIWSVNTAASEAFAEVREHITAVAIQFRGRYHAIGSETGVVIVVDSQEGDHTPTLLWKSQIELSIGHLEWSGDVTRLACAELAGKVAVKEVLIQNDGSWRATLFEVRLKLNSEGIEQILLNDDGNAMLVMIGDLVTVWPCMSLPNSESQQYSLNLPNSKWVNHPTNPALLLAFGTASVSVYRWSDFSKIADIDLKIPRLQANPDRDLGSLRTAPSRATKVSHIFINASKSHFLVDITSGPTTG